MARGRGTDTPVSTVISPRGNPVPHDEAYPINPEFQAGADLGHQVNAIDLAAQDYPKDLQQRLDIAARGFGGSFASLPDIQRRATLELAASDALRKHPLLNGCDQRHFRYFRDDALEQLTTRMDRIEEIGRKIDDPARRQAILHGLDSVKDNHLVLLQNYRPHQKNDAAQTLRSCDRTLLNLAGSALLAQDEMQRARHDQLLPQIETARSQAGKVGKTPTAPVVIIPDNEGWEQVFGAGWEGQYNIKSGMVLLRDPKAADIDKLETIATHEFIHSGQSFDLDSLLTKTRDQARLELGLLEGVTEALSGYACNGTLAPTGDTYHAEVAFILAMLRRSDQSELDGLLALNRLPCQQHEAWLREHIPADRLPPDLLWSSIKVDRKIEETQGKPFEDQVQAADKILDQGDRPFNSWAVNEFFGCIA